MLDISSYEHLSVREILVYVPTARYTHCTFARDVSFSPLKNSREAINGPALEGVMLSKPLFLRWTKK